MANRADVFDCNNSMRYFIWNLDNFCNASNLGKTFNSTMDFCRPFSHEYLAYASSYPNMDFENRIMVWQ